MQLFVLAMLAIRSATAGMIGAPLSPLPGLAQPTRF